MSNEYDYLDIAREVFLDEIEGLKSVLHVLDKSFVAAVDVIAESYGRVIVCGMGKSGIIGKKIAATLASTGTQGYFMHPGEAFHGDLGMVNRADVFVAISYSGETEELLRLLPFLRKNGNKLIAITGCQESTLARKADYHLTVQVPKEACPLQLAPTCSTTATLVMGDALAIALMKRSGFKERDFAVFHPGGSLGRHLLNSVGDKAITKDLPVVSNNALMRDVVSKITVGGLGVAIVIYGSNYGLITDGDLRRAMDEFGSDFLYKKAGDIMTTTPVIVDSNILISEALQIMDDKKISSLLVSYSDSTDIGVFCK